MEAISFPAGDRRRSVKSVGTGVLDGPFWLWLGRTAEDAGPYKSYTGTVAGDSRIAPTNLCVPFARLRVVEGADPYRVARVLWLPCARGAGGGRRLRGCSVTL